jgi:Xaa-Pro aminopeptidase
VQHCQALAGAEREMYEFDVLTHIPMDARLIDKSLLTDFEVNWFNQYQQKVRQTLAPLMQGDELAWLNKVTVAI